MADPLGPVSTEAAQCGQMRSVLLELGFTTDAAEDLVRTYYASHRTALEMAMEKRMEEE